MFSVDGANLDPNRVWEGNRKLGQLRWDSIEKVGGAILDFGDCRRYLGAGELAGVYTERLQLPDGVTAGVEGDCDGEAGVVGPRLCH